MRYSLANYILSVQANDTELQQWFPKVSIGGEGSALDSISISIDNNQWDTTGYATGAWVHNKSLSRTGTVTISINQLSDKVAIFKRMCNMFYSGDYDGFTLTLTDSDGNSVCTCVDCYLEKIPEQGFKSTADNQSWSFTCGEINFTSL